MKYVIFITAYTYGTQMVVRFEISIYTTIEVMESTSNTPIVVKLKIIIFTTIKTMVYG